MLGVSLTTALLLLLLTTLIPLSSSTLPNFALTPRTSPLSLLQTPRTSAAVEASSPLPSPTDIFSAISNVTAAFRAANLPGNCHWERATFYFGFSGSMLITKDPADTAFARSWAEGNAYECGEDFNPNDIGAGWGYAALDAMEPGVPNALKLSETMAAALTQHKLPVYSWWWVDTLSMNVPQWVYYGHAVNRSDFIAFARAQYNQTKLGTGAPNEPGLWDAAHGLWFRDHTFVKSDPPIFWARGNAWASATIIRTLSLNVLPMSDPLMQDLEETLMAMAAAVVPLQGADGFWRTNLLNASAFPEPETSGTAGLLALLAFGVRTGRLSAPAFLPAIASAWSALSTVALRADGTVGHCQPEAAAPGHSSPSNSSDFCTGLWLLAANEVFELVS